jgi:hypothetical protein
VHAEIWTQEPVTGRRIGIIREREHGDHAVGEEDELPGRAQQPSRLGNPPVRVTPDAGAVLGDRQIKAPVGGGNLLGVTVPKRELQSDSRWKARAERSCSAELSMPTTRAPRRASQADT